jgi:hypothetical protein
MAGARLRPVISSVVPTLRIHRDLRGPFEKFVDWRQYAAVMQRET